MAQLRDCALLESAERLKCLDRLSRSMAPAVRPTPAVANWTISETTSPVDYKPFVVATTPSLEGAQRSTMQLSIYCRNGRTELVVAGPAISGRGEDYALSYRVNGDHPVQTAAGAPSFGSGAAFKGDVVGLLQSLPEEGEIAVRLSPRTGIAREGSFSIGGLKMVRQKLAAICKWPQAIATPRN
ncbi:hypothetical protein [Bradyrhizobium australiense]|uniref:hypothetical protein n=1 Tax=Bradyrhizobium australiense TaxID=2721161 RepID=UPI001F3834C1|nr:hypothetical protein [Bradyrhizobium australiense]